MSVYTDTLQPRQPNKNWRWSHSAHLFADTAGELHRFASRVGLKKVWFQDEGYFPHYDLTPNMRAKAVGLGAVPLTRESAVLKWKEIIRRNQTTCDHLTCHGAGTALICDACGTVLAP